MSKENKCACEYDNMYLKDNMYVYAIILREMS